MKHAKLCTKVVKRKMLRVIIYGKITILIFIRYFRSENKDIAQSPKIFSSF